MFDGLGEPNHDESERGDVDRTDKLHSGHLRRNPERRGDGFGPCRDEWRRRGPDECPTDTADGVYRAQRREFELTHDGVPGQHRDGQ